MSQRRNNRRAPSPASTTAETETEPLINPNKPLLAYYDSLESRIGYRLLLGGTRHFGYYDAAAWSPFPIGRALRAMEEKLFGSLNLPRGSVVLDAGCGYGATAIYLARKGLKITAIDLIPRHIERARRTVQKEGLDSEITLKRMDYHHLESIASESHDGAYTMETFVHATDPEGVLASFYRILKPGGKVALYEYDLAEGADDKVLPHFKAEMITVNKYAAMPTNDRARPGFYKDILEGAGFVDVEVEDLSANIRPMLLLFSLLAMVPYLFIKLFRLEKYFINTVAGATAYWGQPYWRYVAVTAKKPGRSP